MLYAGEKNLLGKQQPVKHGVCHLQTQGTKPRDQPLAYTASRPSEGGKGRLYSYRQLHIQHPLPPFKQGSSNTEGILILPLQNGPKGWGRCLTQRRDLRGKRYRPTGGKGTYPQALHKHLQFILQLFVFLRLQQRNREMGISPRGKLPTAPQNTSSQGRHGGGTNTRASGYTLCVQEAPQLAEPMTVGAHAFT